MSYRKKLIEVALPLDAINEAAKSEKSVPRRRHPQTFHPWWARRPLAACRAVVLASLIDDPSSHPEKFPTKADQANERRRLFDFIGNYSRWENSFNKRMSEEAKMEISKNVDLKNLVVVDPFAGGGSIPLEASRMGLSVQGSDLNPVAVLINKALLEYLPRFKDREPIASDLSVKMDLGFEGVAQDIVHYGRKVLEKTHDRLKAAYPVVDATVGGKNQKLQPLAYLWARTVSCPNPACRIQTPLTRSFWIINKPKKQIWISYSYNKKSKKIEFSIERGGKGPAASVSGRTGTKCLACGSEISLEHIRSEGVAGKIGQQLMAIFADGEKEREFLSPSKVQEAAAEIPFEPVLNTDLPEKALGFRVQNYGITTHDQLFTARQLKMLDSFADSIVDIGKDIERDFTKKLGKLDDKRGVEDGGAGARAYADLIQVYLSCAFSRLASYNNTICFWNVKGGSVAYIFARQTIQMSWDFIEVNPFADFSGNWEGAVAWVKDVVGSSILSPKSKILHADARTVELPKSSFVCTDPPYYDQIGYADLSDFFYVWLRRLLKARHPNLFRTVLTPKDAELIATPFRFNGDKNKSKEFFEAGLLDVFKQVRKTDNQLPLVVFYAFKQQEGETTEEDGTESVSSSGWETILSSILNAGFSVIGTWPLRTERPSGVKAAVNALASSVVLVCRPRSKNAPSITKREFLSQLRSDLPDAISKLQVSGIAAVDLQQAAIGPGMEIYSAYNAVLEADDSRVDIRSALVLINQVLDEVLSDSDTLFDLHTRWAISWFESHSYEEGAFGDANALAQAKNVSVDSLKQLGVVFAKSAKVGLVPISKLDDGWTPIKMPQPCLWVSMQHLIKALDEQGEIEAGFILRDLGNSASGCKDLAYRCFAISEKNGWSKEAGYFNTLIISWPEILKHAAGSPNTSKQQEFIEE